jgi:transcriptional regulator with XRE-family HTH domain
VPKSALVKSFGKRIRELRVRHGWSQEDLAHRARLHRNAVSLIELGGRSSTLETIEKLCRAFDVQPRDLIPRL